MTNNMNSSGNNLYSGQSKDTHYHSQLVRFYEFLKRNTVASLMNDYANYRLAFEKEQHQPSDPYWSDPATWPEWANWRAVGEDGCVYFSSILMEANTLYGSWSTSIYAASKMVPRAVTHNPNWRNSLRSREEVSRGK